MSSAASTRKAAGGGTTSHGGGCRAGSVPTAAATASKAPRSAAVKALLLGADAVEAAAADPGLARVLGECRRVAQVGCRPPSLSGFCSRVMIRNPCALPSNDRKSLAFAALQHRHPALAVFAGVRLVTDRVFT